MICDKCGAKLNNNNMKCTVCGYDSEEENNRRKAQKSRHEASLRRYLTDAMGLCVFFIIVFVGIGILLCILLVVKYLSAPWYLLIVLFLPQPALFIYFIFNVILMNNVLKRKPGSLERLYRFQCGRIAPPWHPLHEIYHGLKDDWDRDE